MCFKYIFVNKSIDSNVKEPQFQFCPNTGRNYLEKGREEKCCSVFTIIYKAKYGAGSVIKILYP